MLLIWIKGEKIFHSQINIRDTRHCHIFLLQYVYTFQAIITIYAIITWQNKLIQIIEITISVNMNMFRCDYGVEIGQWKHILKIVSYNLCLILLFQLKQWKLTGRVQVASLIMTSKDLQITRRQKREICFYV